MNRRPTDEELTAYVLNELDEEESERIAFMLQSDKDARESVNALSRSVVAARDSVESKADDKLDDLQRQAILNKVSRASTRPSKKLLGAKFWGSLAATFFIVMTAMWSLPLLSRPREAALRASPENMARQQELERQVESGEAMTLGRGFERNAPMPELDARLGLRVQALTRSEDLKAAAENLRNLDYRGDVEVRTKISVSSNAANLWRNSPLTVQRNHMGTPAQQSPPSAESYARTPETGFRLVNQHPLSTFGVDVDTASYANIRRFLTDRQFPPADAVRIEEMINYFDYAYAPPEGDTPFSVQVEIGLCPWAPTHRLAQVGLKGRVLDDATRPAANLVFLIDVSGSMSSQDKLPLLKQSMKRMVHELGEDDRVAIVTYAGNSALALPSTPAYNKNAILNALNNLQSGGSTNGASGIQLAYHIASENFVDGGANRVLLATDGDFNVGVSDNDQLVKLIEGKAKSNIFLTVLGFGTGNLQDDKMEALADNGNGQFAYIDSLREGRKVLVEEIGGTLVTIAKDVKIQVEFNPAQVDSYRLIGYENRALAAQDFANDAKDAGDIGAGHTVTALYEFVPVGSAKAASTLRYKPTTARPAPTSNTNELFTVSLRYKEPEGTESKLLTFPIVDSDRRTPSSDFKFASAVAAFGMMLRDSAYKGNVTSSDVLTLAEAGLNTDPRGYRAEFMDLVLSANPVLAQRQTQLQRARNVQPGAIQVLRFAPTGDGRFRVRLATDIKKWYSEGDTFDNYELLAIDPNTKCVTIYDTASLNTVDICNPECC